jgi:hypothetical protein
MRLMTQEQPLLEFSAGSVIFPRVRNHVTMAGDLRNRSFQETLVRLIEKADAQLVVVDPLISFIACSENENGDMRQTLDGLSRVMAKTVAASPASVREAGSSRWSIRRLETTQSR